MVKHNFVWLKTLGGLEKVDVIIRRIDDIYCDPLEIKEDSQLGVAGLITGDPQRQRHYCKPAGSSILENPGLMPFLGKLFQDIFLATGSSCPRSRPGGAGSQKK
jgi:uncharacterized circularly permuted ATP-grasp superfamily protein